MSSIVSILSSKHLVVCGFEVSCPCICSAFVLCQISNKTCVSTPNEIDLWLNCSVLSVLLLIVFDLNKKAYVLLLVLCVSVLK